MLESDIARLGLLVVCGDTVPDLVEQDIETLNPHELELESPVTFPGMQYNLLCLFWDGCATVFVSVLSE